MPQTFPAPPDRLLQKIARSFPDLRWQSSRYVTEGWDHEVVILDDDLVFRFPVDETYTRQLKQEIAILDYVRPLVQASVPKYHLRGLDAGFAGYPIVRGVQITKQYFDDLTMATRTDFARQLAAFLSTIHRLDATHPPLNSVPLEMLQNDQSDVKKKANEHLKHVLSLAEFARVDTILSDVDALLAHPVPAVFIHNDIYSRHLLWDDLQNKLGIIDFSDMTISDPAIDFAELHEYGADFVRQVYDLYAGPKNDNFFERAWTYQRWIGVYMMTDHFENHKTSFQIARETFDRTRQKLIY